MTSVRPTHGGNLCYVCRVDKTLWGRKPLAIYAAATRSRNGKAETMYQICSRWPHVREWVLLPLWTALKAPFPSSFSLPPWGPSWLRRWSGSPWSRRLEAYSTEGASSLGSASEYAWRSDGSIRSRIGGYSCPERSSSAGRHLALCVRFWCGLQECFRPSEDHHAFLLIFWIGGTFGRELP